MNCARYQPTPTFPAFRASVESMTPPAVQTRFTRGRVRGFKNGHNSVTVQNRTHVYMNFFHHKGLGNHLLQLCPKVVKHPVYRTKKKSKGIPRQAEVAQGVPGRLRPRIFLTFRHYKGGRSSAKRTGDLYPRINPWYSLSEAESTPGP